MWFRPIDVRRRKTLQGLEKWQVSRLASAGYRRLQQPPRGPSDGLEQPRAPAPAVPVPKGDFPGSRKVGHILRLQLPGQNVVARDQNQLLVHEKAAVIKVRRSDNRPGRINHRCLGVQGAGQIFVNPHARRQ